MHAVLLTAMLVAAPPLGGVDIVIRPSKSDQAHGAFARSAAFPDRPSERTQESLRRLSLDDRWRRDPGSVLAALRRRAREAPAAEEVYALAELSWIESQRLDRRRDPAALDRALDAAAWSWDYLFDPALAPGRTPTDPRYQLACELYNAGVHHLIAIALDSKDRKNQDGAWVFPYHGKPVRLRLALGSSPWNPRDIHELILASRFEVDGLAYKSRQQYGLGVPLIAVRRTPNPGEGPDKFYPQEMAFPLTATLDLQARLKDHVQADPEWDFTLDLLDPVRTRVVGDSTSPLSLEIDHTTPLAYMWSRTDLRRYSYQGLLRPGTVGERAGLMLLRPYEPGKIPVVMVHGLISSPLSWIPMLHELMLDRTIGSRYQFLLYLYPTGVTVPIAAAGLREALTDAERTLGPNDPSFQKTVLLGHSMGGLLSHAVTVDSGSRLLETVTDQPLDSLHGPPEVLAEMQRYFFFQPLPFVKRVVFLATPHRGAAMSRGFVGRLGSGLISEPDHISSMINRLTKDNPEAFDRRFKRLPSSIETLAPDSPILTAILNMTPGPGVAYHSIIGAEHPGPLRGTSDGVVAYTSSHLDGVESERAVRSGHGVQASPDAILEVKRILLKHLSQATAAANPPIQQQPPQQAIAAPPLAPAATAPR